MGLRTATEVGAGDAVPSNMVAGEDVGPEAVASALIASLPANLGSAPGSGDLLASAVRSSALVVAQRDWAMHRDESFALNALDELASTLRLVDAGEVPSQLRAATWTAVARPLMDVLRRQLLSAAAAAADVEAYAECHRWLMALERMHDQLSRDDLYSLTDKLSGAAALDLLVEVAHDMRSPLGSILFLVDRVRSGQSGPLTEPAARQLGLVYSAAFGLSAMASDLMELSRGSGRLVGPEPVEFTVTDVLRRVQDMVRPVAEEKGLQLLIEMPERETRRGHPAALSRVLLNLATNACKFTSRGEVRVLVIGDRSPDTLRFEVHDTGRGMPPEVVARLYDTFRPRTGSGASSGAYAFSSAGLGLAICRKLVAAMGGELTVTTKPNQGACFAFSLQLPRV